MGPGSMAFTSAVSYISSQASTLSERGMTPLETALGSARLSSDGAVWSESVGAPNNTGYTLCTCEQKQCVWPKRTKTKAAVEETCTWPPLSSISNEIDELDGRQSECEDHTKRDKIFMSLHERLR